jgi:hypothetical protein
MRRIQGSGRVAQDWLAEMEEKSVAGACMVKRPRCGEEVWNLATSRGWCMRTRKDPQVVPAFSKFEGLSKRSFLLQFAPRLV